MGNNTISQDLKILQQIPLYETMACFVLITNVLKNIHYIQLSILFISLYPYSQMKSIWKLFDTLRFKADL